MNFKTNPENLKNNLFEPDLSDFSDISAIRDPKISFATKYCRNKNILDIGCVQHNPENYKSKFWMHKALKKVASKITGLDLNKHGVDFLNKLGYDVIYDDACNFELDKKFDTIVAGDIIEHLEDFNGFLKSCKKHMHTESQLIIQTPNPWYWRNTLKAAISKEVSNNVEHTCWLCPRTLRQLLCRHNIEIIEIKFGSRYLRDKIMPLPSGWKNTSFYVAAQLKR